MIKVICYKCANELTEAGGLAFSPPNYSSVKGEESIVNHVDKLHICKKCWTEFEEWLKKS